MSSPEWAQGYLTDINYPDNFFRELSPAWFNYVAALNGAFAHDLQRPFTYLELGCGFGTSTVVNAGAFPHGDFYACDFNSQHIEGGKHHAAELGIGNIQFIEAAFEDLLALALPDFDFIVLHGVYSWVSAETREEIRRVITQKLKPGGLVYISYNCLPGWSVEAPLRKLLLEFAAVGPGDIADRTQQAAHTLQQLGKRLRYVSANPEAIAAVDSYGRAPSNYLAHEFLNRTWEPFYSVDVVAELNDIELDYLGSATLADNHPMLIFDGHAAAAIAALPTWRQRHLAEDFAVNRRFRRDVFVRGHPHLDQVEITRELSAVAIGSVGNPKQINTKVKVPRGEISFQSDFVEELQRLLAGGSITIGEAIVALGGNGRDTVEIARNLIFLVASGTLMPFATTFRSDPAIMPRRHPTTLLERTLTSAIERRAGRVIPSEVLGNGIPIDPLVAAAIAQWLAGADAPGILSAPLGAEIDPAAKDVIENRIPNLVRLGLIV